MRRGDGLLHDSNLARKLLAGFPGKSLVTCDYGCTLESVSKCTEGLLPIASPWNPFNSLSSLFFFFKLLRKCKHNYPRWLIAFFSGDDTHRSSTLH